MANYAIATIAKASRVAASIETAHAASVERGRKLALGIAKLQPSWSKLLLGPYPPASDDSFPRTGDPAYVVSGNAVGVSQRLEPARAAQALIVQADARRPKLSPLFWVGVAALGVGIYLKSRE